jgi:aldehyde dehydrogenase (NAD+)
LLDAGHFAINGGAPVAGPLAPFGGFNMSGNGKKGGSAGLDEFLRVKNVNINLSVG